MEGKTYFLSSVGGEFSGGIEVYNNDTLFYYTMGRIVQYSISSEVISLYTSDSLLKPLTLQKVI